MITVEELMPVIDRVVAPIVERMGRMEGKLDEALTLKGDIAVQTAAQLRTDTRLKSLEEDGEKQRIALAKTEGRNSIINWILALIGAPLVVAAAGAGIVKLMGLG